jgi:hypothetical protein
MMIVTIAVVAVLVFIVAFKLFRLVPISSNAVLVSRSALTVMQDTDLDDLEREKAIQQLSISLLGIAFSIFMRGILTVAVSAIPVFGAGYLGLVNSEDVFAYMFSFKFILFSSVFIIIALFLGRKLWHSK